MLYTLIRGIVIYGRIINTAQIYDISRRTTSSSQHLLQASIYPISVRNTISKSPYSPRGRDIPAYTTHFPAPYASSGWLYALSLCSASVRGGCVHVCTQVCTSVYTVVYTRVHTFALGMFPRSGILTSLRLWLYRRYAPLGESPTDEVRGAL